MEKLVENNPNSSPSSSIFKKFHWKQKQNGNYKLTGGEKENQEPAVRKISLNQEIEKAQNKVIDQTEKYKIDMIVMTEWGIGKILSINEGGIAMVKIEGNDVEFPLMSLNTSLTIYLCILTKDTSFWSEMKVGFDYSVNTLKIKTAFILKCHPSQVILIHGGRKVEKNVNIFELGVYEKDVFLAVVKDPQELSICRANTNKTSFSIQNYNAIRFKSNQDIILTGVGLYKNTQSDISYQLLIFEEDLNMNLKLVYSEKKIPVKCEKIKEEPITKHKISNIEIKENTTYQIHQYLNKIDSGQFYGIKCAEEIVEKNTQIKFQFSNCKIQGRSNTTNVEEGLIPMLYFYVKSEN